jgi:hypothetical protein
MIQFSTIDEVAYLKDSEGSVQKVNDIMAFINDKGGIGEIKQNLIVHENTLYINFSVKIPLVSKKPPKST